VGSIEGAEARWYDNAGSFAVESQDVHGFVEIGFGKGYVGHLGLSRCGLQRGGKQLG